MTLQYSSHTPSDTPVLRAILLYSKANSGPCFDTLSPVRTSSTKLHHFESLKTCVTNPEFVDSPLNKLVLLSGNSVQLFQFCVILDYFQHRPGDIDQKISSYPLVRI